MHLTLMNMSFWGKIQHDPAQPAAEQAYVSEGLSNYIWYMTYPWHGRNLQRWAQSDDAQHVVDCLRPQLWRPMTLIIAHFSS